MHDQPHSTVLAMTAAFQEGDIASVLQTYEPGAVVVGEPGQPLQGAAALRAMFAAFSALRPRFTYYAGHEVLQAGDLALHIAPWQMSGIDPAGELVQGQGLSVSVLRRQPDGSWLMVIDHPYGDLLLKPAAEAR